MESASASDSDSCSQTNEDTPFNTKRFQTMLESLYDELTDSIYEMKRLRKKMKKGVYHLTKEAQEIFKRKEASVQDLLDFWIPLWKDEGRISHNGSMIRLGEEARMIREKPETLINIYDLCNSMLLLFKKT
jgi:hypothetical protein